MDAKDVMALIAGINLWMQTFDVCDISMTVMVSMAVMSEFAGFYQPTVIPDMT